MKNIRLNFSSLCLVLFLIVYLHHGYLSHLNDCCVAYLDMPMVSFRADNLRIDVIMNRTSSRRRLGFCLREIGVFSVCDLTGDA